MHYLLNIFLLLVIFLFFFNNFIRINYQVKKKYYQKLIQMIKLKTTKKVVQIHQLLNQGKCL